MAKVIGMSSGCGFALAISWLEVKAYKVSRASWAGEKWLKQIAPNQWNVSNHHIDETNLPTKGFIALVSDYSIEPWVPTQSDLLAHDWCILEETE